MAERPITERRAAGRRGRHPVGALAIAVLVVWALTACEGLVMVRSDDVRAGVGLPPLARSADLSTTARANSASMCSDGTVTPSADAKADYDQQTIAAAHELVGAAPLDPGIADEQARNQAATDQIWASWSADPAWTDPRWDDLGVGEVTCADGNLYLTAALTERPTLPASGRFVTVQHPAWQVTSNLDLTYGTAVDHLGQTVNLQLDLYLPPSTGGRRPLVILVHGGGFYTGTRQALASVALDWARRGYAAATISYRLNPNLQTDDDPVLYLQTAVNAIDDGMEAVRWLRANAATYALDTDRFAMLGTSAGGGIALAVAASDDPTPVGPLAAVSPKVAAVVSTGASLTLALDQVDFDESDSPALMFHYELDTSTGASDEYAMETCTAFREAGSTCDFVLQAGSGHTVPLGSAGPNFTPHIGPFLWEHLQLASA